MAANHPALFSLEEILSRSPFAICGGEKACGVMVSALCDKIENFAALAWAEEAPKVQF